MYIIKVSQKIRPSHYFGYWLWQLASL